jgi:hypothetical protein
MPAEIFRGPIVVKQKFADFVDFPGVSSGEPPPSYSASFLSIATWR